MTATSQQTEADLVAAARELLPAVRRRAERTESERRVPDETMDELRRARLLSMYRPRRYKGLELDWGAQVRVSRVLGAACGSTSWLTTVLTTHSAMVGRFPEKAQEEVWGDDVDALIATGSARVHGGARPVAGGFEVEGAWRFASGIDHSRWVMVPAPVEGIDAVGPAALRQCLVPIDEVEIVDDWFVAGLGGTGSKQAAVRGPVFVPEHRTLPFLGLLGRRPPGGELNDGYVYRMEFGPYFGTILLGPVLGLAEGALADYLDLTRARQGAIRGNRVAESLSVQLRVAESAAEISAAALMVERTLDVLHRRGSADELLMPEERVVSMRDRAYATRTCVDAVHRLVRQMGAVGLSAENPVQRHFRDISAASAQIGLNWDRNAGTYGMWALGVPTGDDAIDGPVPAPQGDTADSVG